MNEGQLLELAAKAAGIRLSPVAPNLRWDGEDDEFIYWIYWNPLTVDGDALRLVVDLRLYIEQYSERVGAWKIGLEAKESLGDDPYAATRRAIVRAAAKIGSEME
jgi:hypothetical protein